jgi:hypothetical protein
MFARLLPKLSKFKDTLYRVGVTYVN